MGNTADDWSPADNPYATAVSEAGWWVRAVQLTARRLGQDDEQMLPYSSRQIDARTLILALSQLLTAERLQQTALASLQIDPVVGEQLAHAREAFLAALPGLSDMRDSLVHFDEWSRGTGRSSQRTRAKAGEELRNIAASHWGFRYDAQARTITVGPRSIDIDRRCRRPTAWRPRSI